jgi:hypothetical protein
MDTATLIVTIAGLVTTLLAGVGGPLLQTRFAARTERRTQSRADRTALYVAAMIHVQHVSDSTDYLVGDVLHPSPAPSGERPSEDELTARMRLLAPPQLLTPWLELVAARREIRYNTQEVWEPEPGWGRPMPDRTEPSVAQLLRAIDALRSEMRAEIEA